MNCRQTRDVLKRLFFIDKQPWMSETEWVVFRDGPVNYFMAANHEIANKLWSLIYSEEEFTAKLGSLLRVTEPDGSQWVSADALDELLRGR